MPTDGGVDIGVWEFFMRPNAEILPKIRGFLFSKNSGNMMYQKALHHFG
jgi:hypothetical protein